MRKSQFLQGMAREVSANHGHHIIGQVVAEIAAEWAAKAGVVWDAEEVKKVRVVDGRIWPDDVSMAISTAEQEKLAKDAAARYNAWARLYDLVKDLDRSDATISGKALRIALTQFLDEVHRELSR